MIAIESLLRLRPDSRSISRKYGEIVEVGSTYRYPLMTMSFYNLQQMQLFLKFDDVDSIVHIVHADQYLGGETNQAY